EEISEICIGSTKLAQLSRLLRIFGSIGRGATHNRRHLDRFDCFPGRAFGHDLSRRSIHRVLTSMALTPQGVAIKPPQSPHGRVSLKIVCDRCWAVQPVRPDAAATGAKAVTEGTWASRGSGKAQRPN